MRIALLALVLVLPIAYGMLAPMPETVELCPMGMTMAEMAAMGKQDPAPGQDPPATPVDPDDPYNGDNPVIGNPSHTEPMDFCYRDMPSDGKGACTCLMNRPGACSPDRANEEVRSCNSWCWKMKWCHCCKS